MKLRKYKKNSFEIKHKVTFDFDQKAADNGDLFIEGYANRAVMDGGEKVIDRGQEHIPVEEWDITEFMKNPIIFLNHDRSMIVGKAVEAEIRKEGLWIKVLLSNSKNAEISKVRDLVREGILKTFSVGIDVTSEQLEEDGSLTLKGVNLLETSIVSIPMNQESFFTISKKSLENDSVDRIGSKIFKAKGAWVAAAIHNRIFEMMRDQEGFNRAEALTLVASEAEISSAELFDILAGNTLSVEEPVLQSLSKNLEMDFEELQKLNQGDIQVADPDSELLPEDEEAVEDELEEENKPDEDPAPIDNPEDKPEDKPDEEEDKEKEFNDKLVTLVVEGLEKEKDQDIVIASAIKNIKELGFSQKLNQKNWDSIFKAIDDSKEKENPTDGIDQNGANAAIQLTMQTNVLLSQLIGKFEGLTKLLEGLQPKVSVPEEEQNLPEETEENLPDEELSEENSEMEDSEEMKNLDIVSRYSEQLKKKLATID